MRRGGTGLKDRITYPNRNLVETHEFNQLV